MSEFDTMSLKEHGRILSGQFAHYCWDWGGMTVDETTPEWASCSCYEAIALPAADVAKARGGEMTNPYVWRTPKEQSEYTAQLQLRKTQLTAMLALRRGKPGFAANAIAIEAELARVDEEIANGSDGALPDTIP